MDVLIGAAEQLFKQSRFKDALHAFQEILNTQMTTDTPDRHVILTAQRNIAKILNKLGKRAEAWEQLLDIQEHIQRYGDYDEFSTLRDEILAEHSLHNRNKSELELREKFYFKNLDDFGPEDLRTLESERNLALVHLKLGRYSMAFEMLLAIYKKTAKLLGPNHLATLISQNDIGFVHLKKKNYTKALKIFNEVYDKQKKQNPRHLFMLSIMHCIAEANSGTGRHESAYGMFNAIYEKEENGRPGNQHNLTSLIAMAVQLAEINKHDAAMNILSKICNSLKDYPTDLHKLSAEKVIASILYKQGKYEEAMRYLTDLFRVAENGNLHNHAVDILKKIAEILCHDKKYELSLETLNIIYDRQIRQNYFDPGHLDVLDTKYFIAIIHSKQSKFKKALGLYEKLLRKMRIVLGRDHLNCLEVENRIAHEKLNLGKYKEALEIYWRVYKERERVLGPNNESTKEAEKYVTCVMKMSQSNIVKAVIAGDVNSLAACIESGEDVNDKDIFHWTPLHFASQKGNTEIVKYLLSKGAIYNTKTKKDETPEYFAVKLAIKSIFKAVGMLFFAVKMGTSEYATKLIEEARSVINVRDQNGETLLFSAVRRNHKIFRILLDNGCDPTFPNNKGETPLHMASSRDDIEIVEALLEQVKRTNLCKLASFVDTESIHGTTALINATTERHLEIAELLMRYGADPTVKTKTNKRLYELTL